MAVDEGDVGSRGERMAQRFRLGMNAGGQLDPVHPRVRNGEQERLILR